MNQDNQFHQYGYDHYLKAPNKPRASSRTGYIGDLPSRLLGYARNPAVATFSLVVAAVLFVGIIIATYPSGDDAQGNIPIIKADLRPIKTEPVKRGGMSIPHSDSTILARSGQGVAAGDAEYIENLLSQSSPEELMSKEQAIERAMASSPISIAGVDTYASSDVSIDIQDAKADLVEPMPVIVQEVVKADIADIKEPSDKDILQKIGSLSSDASAKTTEAGEDLSEFAKMAAQAAISVKPKKIKIHAAATSPETLEFVRKILENGSSESAIESSTIEPSVGAASAAVNMAAGAYFVQLASITDPKRAGAEWAKMKARYDALSSADFRVQEASLPRGTFYRIQAGPMSKERANEVCEALKAKGKAGGCLVVK